MARGTVKWFNTTKGYGFISPQDGKKDIFIHITELEKSNIRSLDDGQEVEFETSTGKDGRPSAINVKKI